MDRIGSAPVLHKLDAHAGKLPASLLSVSGTSHQIHVKHQPQRHCLSTQPNANNRGPLPTSSAAGINWGLGPLCGGLTSALLHAPAALTGPCATDTPAPTSARLRKAIKCLAQNSCMCNIMPSLHASTSASSCLCSWWTWLAVSLKPQSLGRVDLSPRWQSQSQTASHVDRSMRS